MLIDLQSSWEASGFSAISQLSSSFRNVRNRSLYAGDDATLLGGFFHPALVPWSIPADRMGRGVGYRQDTNNDVSWLSNESAITGWNSPSERARTGTAYLRDPGQSVGWVFPVLPVSFDPAAQDWTIHTDRIRPGSSYPRDTNAEIQWLYDTTPIVGWTAQTDRLARSLGTWKQDTNDDNAWIYTTVPVVVVFDPALFPGIAELVGWRTPSSPSLSVPRGIFVYDLSWVHDVIPLTDPVPSTFIRLRPIAPIVHSRRRKRRR